MLNVNTSLKCCKIQNFKFGSMFDDVLIRGTRKIIRVGMCQNFQREVGYKDEWIAIIFRYHMISDFVSMGLTWYNFNFDVVKFVLTFQILKTCWWKLRFTTSHDKTSSRLHNQLTQLPATTLSKMTWRAGLVNNVWLLSVT